MSKYKLLKNDTKEWCGITLFRIEATASFGSVSKGDKGGFIEKEVNLEQDGNAWVYGDARVSGNAWVYGKLKLSRGYFFGLRYKKEEIKYHKLDEDYELIYKGDAKIEEGDKGDAKIEEGDGNSEKKAAILAKIEELKEEADKL